eukprot:COSAG01_NODE_37453_length_503_cov_1.024752_1_plen_38_part_01
MQFSGQRKRYSRRLRPAWMTTPEKFFPEKKFWLQQHQK